MVRTIDEELRHRWTLRQKYFEDPKYLRWSDVVPGGIDGQKYMTWRDDRLFDYLITNQVAIQSNLSKLKTYLREGHKLPINWSNFYAYFDERLNDPDNRFIKDLTEIELYDFSGQRFTVQTLLDHYREHLYHTYDIIWERRREITNELISNLLRNLKHQHKYEPKYQNEKDNRFEMQFAECQFTINTDNLHLEATIQIAYDLTFSMDNVHYLLNKGIHNWYIYKHFLAFSYVPLNEEDLQQTLINLLETYE